MPTFDNHLIYIMTLFKKIIYYISVPKCVGCKARLDINELALCNKCKLEYDDILLRNCSKCGKKLNECFCTNKFLDSHYVHNVVKVFRYLIDEELPTNKLIYSLKHNNRRDVLKLLSEELAKAVKNNIVSLDNFLVTNIPRNRRSYRIEGFDHAVYLAKAVAKLLNIPYQSLLISKTKREQKKSGNRQGRLHNISFEIKKNCPDIKDKNIIIIDDIITSGASMSIAAALLKGEGAKKIIAASLAIAYKDEDDTRLPQ